MIRLAMLAEHSADARSVDGGVQAVTRYLVDELVKSDQLDVHVLSFDYGADTIETRTIRNYTWHRIPAGRLGAFTIYRRDQEVMNAHLQTLCPDIVHSQGAGHYGIVATRSPYPCVVTIHGIMSEEARHAATLRLKLRRWLVSSLSDRYCIRGDKHTILISPYVADFYGDKLSGTRSLIPNPVAQQFFSVERAEKPGKIVFAGRLLPLKGVHDLLEATAAVGRLRDVELILAGSLDNCRYVSRLRSQARTLNVENRVQFRGILDESELLNELAEASALVLPSYQETAPMVIQEAMAAGVPVIATRVGGVAYQIEHGETGFIIEPGDVETLTETLGTLLQDDKLRKTIASSARSYADDTYRAEGIAHRTIETYKRLLDLKHSRDESNVDS